MAIEDQTDVKTEDDVESKTAHEIQVLARLEKILLLKSDGLSNAMIAGHVFLDEASIENILRLHNDQKNLEPLSSSLALSFTNHTPNDQQIILIEAIRMAADELCHVLDLAMPQSREAALARTHLEETVMWAVKSIVMPKQTTMVNAQTGAVSFRSDPNLIGPSYPISTTHRTA